VIDKNKQTFGKRPSKLLRGIPAAFAVKWFRKITSK